MTHINGHRYTGDDRARELLRRLVSLPSTGPEEQAAVAGAINQAICNPPLDATELARVRADARGGVRHQALDAARKALGLDNGAGPFLARVIKRSQDDALYDLELADGRIIPLGPIDHLKDPRKVENAIGDHLGFLPPYMTPTKFRDVANLLLSVAELEDSGTSSEEITCAWIASFLGSSSTVLTVDLQTEDARTRYANSGRAFRDEHHRLWLYLPDLERHLRVMERLPIAARDITARLQRLGFTQGRVEEPRHERGQTTKKRRYWVSTPGFDFDDHVSPPPVLSGTHAKPAGDTGDTGDTAPHSLGAATAAGDTLGIHTRSEPA